MIGLTYLPESVLRKPEPDVEPSCASGAARSRATARRAASAFQAAFDFDAERPRQAIDPAGVGHDAQQQLGTEPDRLGAVAPAAVSAGQRDRVERRSRPTPRPSTSAAAKLARPISDRADSQLRPPGQPPTLGGLKRSCPSRRRPVGQDERAGGRVEQLQRRARRRR